MLNTMRPFRQNKQIFLWLLFVIPLMAMFPWKKKKLQSYFPLTKGSWWEYWQYTPSDREYFMMPGMTITGDTTLNGKQYRVRATAEKNSAMWAGYWRFSGTKLYQNRLNYKEEILQVDFNAREGTKRAIHRDTLYYNLVVLNTDTVFEALDTTFAHVYC